MTGRGEGGGGDGRGNRGEEEERRKGDWLLDKNSGDGDKEERTKLY